MPVPFLHTSIGAYDRAEIMRRSWVRARNAMARCAKARIPTTFRECLADALRRTWDEAKSARSIAQWQAERAAADEAAKLLDDRTREIMALREAREMSIGIDNTRNFLAEVRAIDARLVQLGA